MVDRLLHRRSSGRRMAARRRRRRPSGACSYLFATMVLVPLLLTSSSSSSNTVFLWMVQAQAQESDVSSTLDVTAVLGPPGAPSSLFNARERRDLPMPGGRAWADSYSVGNRCYCRSTFDHLGDQMVVETEELGWRKITEICKLLGPGPGWSGRPIYNDFQCGNGPPNDAGDEHYCPGRTDLGLDGCGIIGPKWNFNRLTPREKVKPRTTPDASAHNDVVAVVRSLATIPRPRFRATPNSYSVGNRCFCLPGISEMVRRTYVDTKIPQLGWMRVSEICARLGRGPGPEGRPKYNDVQCGNGPGSDEANEHLCPGRVDMSAAECRHIGPKWNFSDLVSQNVEKQGKSLIGGGIVVSGLPNGSSCAENLIKNSANAADIRRFWTPEGSGGRMSVVTDSSGRAILYQGRRQRSDRLVYDAASHIDTRCISPGSSYYLEADVRLFRRSDIRLSKPIGCANADCPALRILMEDSRGNRVTYGRFNEYDGTWLNGFNHVKGLVHFPSDWDGTVGTFDLDIRGFPIQWSAVIDNVSLRRSSCNDNLVQNERFGSGALGWKGVDQRRRAGRLEAANLGPLSVIRYSRRSSVADGPAYDADKFLSLDCLIPGQTYQITADLRLERRGTRVPSICTLQNTCPKIRVFGRDSKNREFINLRLRDYPSITRWDRRSFNRLDVTFTLPNRAQWDGTVNTFRLELRDFPTGLDIVVNRFTLNPV